MCLILNCFSRCIRQRIGPLFSDIGFTFFGHLNPNFAGTFVQNFLLAKHKGVQGKMRLEE